jgi:RimJ/RimL family protein N-acetyltransferase
MTLTEEVVAQTPRRHEIPVLKTERLILRAPRLADVKAIVQLANDRRIAENAARIPHPYGTEDAEQFVTSVNRRDGEACFVAICSGKPVGVCSVELREGGAELGYWLGAPYWGLGFATEAARAAIDYAFGDLGHQELLSSARVSNPASRRVL